MEKPTAIGEMGKEIPYDLRQVYAVDILGEHLKDIARARKADNYSNYFKCLKDLWIVSQHKFKDKKAKIALTINGKLTEKELSPREHYNLLVVNVIAVANKYSNEFMSGKGDADGCALIEITLNEIETFLYDKIQEAGLFGSSKYIPGL